MKFFKVLMLIGLFSSSASYAADDFICVKVRGLIFNKQDGGYQIIGDTYTNGKKDGSGISFGSWSEVDTHMVSLAMQTNRYYCRNNSTVEVKGTPHYLVDDGT